MHVLFKIIPMTGVSPYPGNAAPLLQPVKSAPIQQLCEPRRRLCDSFHNKLPSSVSPIVPIADFCECRTLKCCTDCDPCSCCSAFRNTDADTAKE